MNILVIGLGSMGKRRIRLIRELFPDVAIYGVDGRGDRREEAFEKYKIESYSVIEEVSKKIKIEAAFVCTSPLSHSSIISKCLENSWHVFSELNLVLDGYEENIKLAKKNSRILFLSSTFLYREEIIYLRGKIDKSSKWNYVYHIGQYLPDWHPWENYKDFFVADKRTNGCREIMAIELPWIVNIFGDIRKKSIVTDKMTQLKIDYNDNYLIQVQHENGNKGVLVVDIVSPVAVRRLEVYSENKYFQWSGTPDSLLEYDLGEDKLKRVQLNEIGEHRDGYKTFIVENAYKNEIKDFFDTINKSKKPIYGFEQDMAILNLINELEGIC